ncbi:hypothetical protein [Pantanalinema sp. GBBB05]|uniref:hypothetical protein n=1 Tax=Pantanalinema sp. GBBB05 TaxID=2604139 RepID=UPI001D54617D|nr:hypothetical protein [Pantanalinema sp. GBBB05]
MSPLCLLPTALSELFAQVSTTNVLTLADRYGIQAALLNEAMSDEDRQMVDRLLYALRHRRIQIVNDLSVVL